MITAKEVQTIMKNAMENEFALKKATALKICDEIGKEIVNSAKRKQRTYEIEIEMEFRSFVVEELRNNGYDVKAKPAEKLIEINW